MEEELKDRWLKCVDCSNDFIFEVGEQRYYKERSLLTPHRCPSCRKLKRLRKEDNLNG